MLLETMTSRLMLGLMISMKLNQKWKKLQKSFVVNERKQRSQRRKPRSALLPKSQRRKQQREFQRRRLQRKSQSLSKKQRSALFDVGSRGFMRSRFEDLDTFHSFPFP